MNAPFTPARAGPLTPEKAAWAMRQPEIRALIADFITLDDEQQGAIRRIVAKIAEATP